MTKYDFTDSIVTQVKWAENLLDLMVVVDYYWDIQEGRDETRLLCITFKDCISADFKFGKTLPIYEDEVNIESCFTIVLFNENLESEAVTKNYKCIEIHTTDYSRPWLSVICRDVILEETLS